MAIKNDLKSDAAVFSFVGITHRISWLDTFDGCNLLWKKWIFKDRVQGGSW